MASRTIHAAWVVIIGDGHDNASTHTLEQAIELAQRNLVTVYSINTEAVWVQQRVQEKPR
jgi:hypothetical protein